MANFNPDQDWWEAGITKARARSGGVSANEVRMGRFAAPLILLTFLTVGSRAETVEVKYRGPVDLSDFSCVSIERSSFIRRVRYDRANAYMIISLNGTYYGVEAWGGVPQALAPRCCLHQNQVRFSE
jgi:hypothetical protein